MKNKSPLHAYQSDLIAEELEVRQLFSGGIEGLVETSLISTTYSDDEDDEKNNSDETQSASSSTEEAQSHEVVFVDTTVKDHQALINDILNNGDSTRKLEIVLLEPDEDGIDTISKTLQNYDDLDAVHIISHGSDGNVRLGNNNLNSETLTENNLDVALWANAFDEAGDILIYGCNLAESEVGKDLINDLSELTLADVAASDDLTGDTADGGDWVLEYNTGKVESAVAISSDLQYSYQQTFATIQVTNLNDSGAGSLRQAIIDADGSAGLDIIEFSVSGTINLSSALPNISDQIIIDGTTVPGYAGEPLVRIDGSSAGAGNGLTFADGSDGSSVQGLMITNFSGNGIQIDNGADGITIQGNWIGTTGTGTTGDGNSNNGINVQGANTVIGGTGPNDGNVITNNGNEGINLTGTGATGTIIQSNIIGLDPDGSTGSGNADVGIAVLAGAHNTVIGGTDPNAGNIISMNFEGIEINSNNNTIQGNYIGTDITGTQDRGNRSDDGIEIQNNATGNLIGGTEAGAGNLIAFNSLDGINLVSGSGNTVLGNSIYANGDQDIDLGAGANGSQSPPSLASAAAAQNQIVITGSLNAAASDFYRIEFFSDSGGVQTYIGYANVATDGSGNATINATLNASVPVGATISATATRSEATYTTFSDSSEMGASVAAVEGNKAPTAVADSYTVSEDATLNASTGWFDTNWQYSRTLSFDNSTRTENLVDFPVLIKLDSGVIDYAKTHDQGWDLRFFDQDGTALSHEIELWDEAGTSYVWVKIPQIDAASNVDSIVMYYGNSGVTDSGEDSAGVWSDYRAIYHLNENPGATGTVSDAAGNFDAVNAGSTDTAGIIGNAQDFNGIDQYINLGDDRNWINNSSTASISIWMNADTTSGSGDLIGITRNDPADTGASRFTLIRNGDDIQLIARTMDDSSDSVSVTTNTNPLSAGQWHHITGTIDYASDVDNIKIYVDGQLEGTFSHNFTLNAIPNTDSSHATIGSDEDGLSGYFDGQLDDARISDQLRSDDWISAQYAAMTGTLVNVGFEQTVQGVLVNDVDDEGNILTVTELNGVAAAIATPTTLPSGAIVTLNADGSFTYDTNGAFESLGIGDSANDSFTYLIDDGNGNNDSASVTITITGVDDAPVIGGTDTGSVTEDVGVVSGNLGVSGSLTITDADAGESSYQAATITGSYGDLIIDSAGNWSYTADNSQPAIQALGQGQTLTDTLTVTAFDGATHDIVITIIGTDDAAIIGGDTGYSGNEGDTVAGTMSATDTEGLTDGTYFSVTSPATNGNAVIDPASGNWTYSPTDPYWSGTDSFIVTVTDDLGGTTTQVINITLAEVNSTPTGLQITATNSGGLNLNDDGGNDTYLVADSGLTSALSQFTFETQFVGSNGSTEVPFISYNTASGDIMTVNTMADNTLELDIGTGAVVFSSAIDYNATLMDGQPHTLSVSWDNTAGDWAVYIDGALVDSGTGLSVGQSIPTGGTLMFGLEQDAVGGSFESQEFFNGTLYDIRLFNDVRSATEIANNYDQALASSEPGMIANWIFDNVTSNGVVTETVSGNNLTEQHFVGAGFTSSSPNLTLSIPEDASNGTAVGTLSAVDPDVGDTFDYILIDDANGRFDINLTSGVITLIDSSQIDFEVATLHDVTVRVTDSGGLTFDKIFTIEITNVNETPVAVADSITAIEGVPYVAQLTVDDLLLNDSDPDGDTLTVNTTPVSGPTNGSLVLNADGTFTYTPNTDFNGTDAFTYQVLDGNGGTAQATVNITVQPREVRILFSTASDVNNSKVPGVASWDAGEVLGIGDPNLSFEPAGSDGSVLPYMDLEQFAASNNMTLNGLHFVSNDITVGGANSVDLQRGDLLFVSENNETMTSINSLAINAGDVIIFRPTAVDDYSSGTFIHLLDQPGTAMTTGITLIEKDVTIGDVTLSAGGFLFTQQSIVEESSIYHFSADDVGAGTTDGTVSTLISSVDIDVNFNNFVGVMVINEDLYLDGTIVPAGSIVTTLAGGDSFVGDNGVMINNDEIFYLTVHTTTMGSGTTSADATLLFDGGEIGLNNSSKKMNNLTIIEEITPANADPGITLTASALSYTEQNPPIVIDSAATLVDPDSTNFDTGILRVDLTGGSANDRLSINHQGTGGGQIGVSGNTVSYAGITIGTFSGGGSGSEPLLIVLNTDATVPAVEALMRNITYENVSPNPSTAVRTATFTVTDGDGGSSTPVARNINVSSVNDAPVLSGANDLATINEDAFNNGGTLVSDLISGFVTDTDAGALEGIAVVAVDDTNGSWQFTTDNGATWTAFGTVSTNAATLLAADADTRVRFVPDPGWNGTVSNGITFHAWDQSVGTNGDTVDLTLVANVSDQFNAVSYANDDGSAVWTSNWTESNDDAAAATGNVRVESGKLHLDNLDGGTAESITRSADLSAAATAMLTFDYDGYGAGSLDTVAFEVSNDGGSSWTLLENVDIVGNVSDSKSYTLEDFTTLTADMKVRISIVQGFDGASEQINIDNFDIAYAGPGVGGSGAVSVATASSSISVTSVNNAPTMTMWYNEDWSTRKQLSIDATQVAGDVTDFPVLITFNTDAELAAQALANGDDIIFTAGDGGTLLAHEIEFFDETTGELRAWVKTDLSASVNTEIYMYFGNATATNQENAAGVWSSNYVGVYHLDESPSGTPGEIIDASGSGNHAVTEGGMDVADSVNTAIGTGLAFDGANDMIRIPDSGSLDGLNDAATFSLWINWVDAADGDHQIIMASDNRYSGGDGYEWASQGDGDHFFYPDATSPDGNYNLGANPFTNNNWHHLAATMDYTTREVKIYIDGNEMSFSYEGVPSRWTDLSASGDLLFGGNPDRATRFFDGMMDEIRLSDVVRSQEWIQTEANNQSNPGTFLSVASSETVLTRDSLTDINEDEFNSPGNSVLSIISSSGSDRIMDDDASAVEGIAVIAVDDTNGQWQYDANADGSWVAFGNVSDTSAVLLDTGALIRFVPNADYNGPAGDLTFRAWDQTSGVNGNTGIDVSANGGSSAYSSETFGATLNVLAVNDAPVNTVPGAQTVNEDTVLNITGISVNDVDGNLATTQLTVTNGSLNVSLAGGATISAGANDSNTLTLSGSQAQINAALASLSYLGNSNFNGSDSLTVLSTDSDGTPLSDSDAVAITVNAVNDEQVLTTNTGATVSEGSTANVVTTAMLHTTDVDNTDAQLVYTVDATPGNGTLYNNGVALAATDTFTQADIDAGLITYDHDGSQTAADSFDFTVDDGAGTTTSGTFNWIVTNTNDAPVNTVPGAQTVNEDTALNITGISVNDVDGNLATTQLTVTNGTLNVSLVGGATVSAGANGSNTLTLSGSQSQINTALATLSYQGNLNFNGSDTLTVLSTDSDGTPLSDSDAVAITVNGVNDPGAFGGNLSATTNEDTATAGSVTFTDSADGFTTPDFTINTVASNGTATISAAGDWTYTPTANFNGTDSFVVQVTDDDGNVETQTINITVNQANDAGTFGGNLSATNNEDTATAGSVTFTDSADGFTTPDFSINTAATNGAAVIDSNGNWTYTPDANYNGADSFVVQVTDDDGNVETQVINITVNAVNDEQVLATNTGATVSEGSTANVVTTAMLHTTDVDNTDAQLVYTVDSIPGNGTLYNNGVALAATDTFTQADIDAGLITYDHDGSQTAADSFDFTVDDGAGTTTSGTFNWIVTNTNDAPVNTVPGAQTVNEDTALNITGISVNDVDGNLATTQLTVTNGNLSVSLAGGATISAGANGSNTLTLSGSQAQINTALATLSYQGNLNFNGSDTLTVLSTDSDGTPLSDSDAVAITVNAVNDPGAFGGNLSATTNEDTATAGSVTFTDSADGFTTPDFTINTVASNGTATINAAGDWTYTPTANFNGTDSFVVQVTDDDGNVETQTINITVNQANDAGTFGGNLSATTNEDTATAGSVTFTDSADGFTTPDFSINTAATNGAAAIDSAGNWTYNPNSNFNGADSFVVQVTDDDGNVETQTITITVNAVNDPGAFGGNLSATTSEDTATGGTVTFTDIADGFTTPDFTINTVAGNGTAAIDSNGNWTYTPDAHYNGSDSFVIQVTDDDGNVETQTISVSINQVNDAAVIAGTDTGSVQEDVAVVTNNISTTGTLTITDVDTGEASFQAETINGSYGSLVMQSNGNWTYSADNTQAAIQSLDLGESLTDTLTVTSFDGTTHNVVITLNGSDDAAVIGGTTTGSVTEDGPLTSTGTLTITDNDTSDPTDFVDVAVAASDNGYGTFAMTGNSWTFTLDNNHAAVQALDVGESLTDTFTFSAPDGVSQQVSVTINGAEDTPIFDSTAVTAATEDSAYIYAITTRDVDVEAVTITAPTLPAWLTLTDNGDGTGTLSGTPTNAEVGDHIVVLEVFDGSFTTQQNFTITVAKLNDPAVIGGVDSGSVQEDVAVVNSNISTSGTLTITDPDAGESSFVPGTATGIYGDLTIDASGNWNYTADNTQAAIQSLDTGESLTDTLTVTSFDGTTHNVVITITGSEDAAVIGGSSSGSVTEDSTLSVNQTLTIVDVDSTDNPISFTDMAATQGDNGYGTFEISANNWTFILDNTNAAIQSLDSGEAVTDTFTFVASNGMTQQVTVTINGAEDQALISGTMVGTVSEDGPLTASGVISISDQDASDNPISLTDVIGVSSDNGYGNFSLIGGSWTYTLDNTNAGVQALGLGQSLNDTASFTASDGSVHLVSIIINAANDEAVFSGDDSGVVVEDEPVENNTLVTSGTLNVADSDAQESTFVAETIDGNYGELSISDSGSWTYSVDNSLAVIQNLDEGDTIADSISVRSADGSTHNINITIYGARDYVVVTGNSSPGEVDGEQEQAGETIDTVNSGSELSTTDVLAGNITDDLVSSVIPEELSAASEQQDSINQGLQSPPGNETEVEDAVNNFEGDAENTEIQTKSAKEIPVQVKTQSLSELLKLRAERDQINNQLKLSSSDFDLNLDDENQLWKKIDEMQREMDEDSSAKSSENTEIKVALGSTVSLTTGFIAWILRGGSLLASMMTTFPILNRFDPLPILKTRRENIDVDTEDDSENDARVDRMFEKEKEVVDDHQRY